jgi:hypothetical protein
VFAGEISLSMRIKEIMNFKNYDFSEKPKNFILAPKLLNFSLNNNLECLSLTAFPA